MALRSATRKSAGRRRGKVSKDASNRVSKRVKNRLSSTKLDKPDMASQMAPHFYDLTRAWPREQDFRIEGVLQDLLVNAYKVEIDPRDADRVSRYFEETYGSDAGMLRTKGQLQLCCRVLDEATRTFSHNNSMLHSQSRDQKCIIFALPSNAEQMQMSNMSISVYDMIVTRMRIREYPGEIDHSAVSGYIQLFASSSDRESRASGFNWDSGSEAAQIKETVKWLLSNIIPSDVRKIFALYPLTVTDGKHNPLRVNSDDFGYEVRGISDALIIFASRLCVMAVIELKKEPHLIHMRQLILQMYAAQRRSKGYSVFGVLTDLNADWRILWFGNNKIKGITPVYHFHFLETTSALQCIRAMLCSNLRQNRDKMPSFIVFNHEDDDGNNRPPWPQRLSGDRLAWRDTVNQQTNKMFNQSRPAHGAMAGTSRGSGRYEAGEPLDANLYQALEDEGVWDVELDFAEMPHADNPELQTKLLCEAMARLDDLSDNEVMARMYRRIQSDRAAEQNRANEASRLASERVQRLLGSVTM